MSFPTVFTRPGHAQDKELTIKDVMLRVHKGPNSLLSVTTLELKAVEPNWEDLEKQTKELVRLAEILEKSQPPQGEEGSWRKLSKQYLDTAKRLNEAVSARNKPSAQSARAKLAGSCTACHKVHRPS